MIEFENIEELREQLVQVLMDIENFELSMCNKYKKPCSFASIIYEYLDIEDSTEADRLHMLKKELKKRIKNIEK